VCIWTGEKREGGEKEEREKGGERDEGGEDLWGIKTKGVLDPQKDRKGL
jgi:hypothetical protein